MAKLTRYKNPSIADRVAAAPDIETLNELRNEILSGISYGALQPSDKTLVAWSENIMRRMIALLLAAPTPGDACYVFNVAMKWEHSEKTERALREILRRRCADLPDDVERAARQGIVYEGISTPVQVRAAAAIRRWVMTPPTGMAALALTYIA